MKKKFNLGVLPRPTLKILIMRLKIAMILFLASAANTFGTKSYAQEVKISLNMHNNTVEQVIDEIERQSEFYFIFNQKQIDVDRMVDIEVNNKLIEEILPALFAGTNVSYSIIDRNILLLTNLIGESLKEIPSVTHRQQVLISGTVTDESNGEPMAGVNIQVKGTTLGTMTDINGKYTLPATLEKEAILIFSFIGYERLEIPLAGRTTIDVTLKSEITGLEEVVVIGYGTVKRKELTGAVSSISAKDLTEAVGRAQVDEALIGKIAGVQVQYADGEPGNPPKILVRGVSSISAGSEPLYIVDGMPMENIKNLNMNDVESIDVLKDASATAIYGSRGANGVVILTTKRGIKGQPVISFDFYTGFQKVSKIREQLNAKQMAQYYFDGIKNANLDKANDISGNPLNWKIPVAIEALDVIEGRNTRDVNALDYVLRTAPLQHYSLSIRGSDNNITYAISGEYLDQDGIVIETGYKRLALRANFDAQLREKLKVSLNVNPTYSIRNQNPSGGHASEPSHLSVIGIATTLPNYFPVLASDEVPGGNAVYTAYDGYYKIEGYGSSANLANPVATAREIKMKNNNTGLLANMNLKYNLFDELSFNFMLGGNIQNTIATSWRPDLPNVFYAFAGTAEGSDDRTWYQSWITEAILNYNLNIGDHTIAAVGGMTAQTDRTHSSEISSTQFPSNYVQTLNAASEISNGASSISEWSLLSYLARINYNYRNKYYFAGSIRADGSSRFGSANRWGMFPSLGLTWRISEEQFLKNIPVISDLKLRTSYGETGNHNIGNYSHLATVSFTQYPSGSGYSPSGIANPNLGWEKQRQWSSALEVGFFKSRLNLILEYSYSVSSDLLLNVQVPRTTGFSSTLMNIGKVKNTGWELTLNSVNISSGNFTWTTDFNISTFSNEVLNLGPEGAPLLSGSHITAVGRPVGMFRGWIVDKERPIFLNQEEVNAGPIWNPTSNADRSRPGDFRFVDQNGDNKIGNEDRVEMGSPYPDFYFGMTNRFSYKNISVSISMNGISGNQILCESARSNFNTRGRFKQIIQAWDYWKSPEDIGDGKTPRPNHQPTGGNRTSWSTAVLQDGSYLRISNINVGYTFSSIVLNKLRLNSFKIYYNAINPFTFTKFNGFNPEVSNNASSNLYPGVDINNYPIAKSHMIGVALTF